MLTWVTISLLIGALGLYFGMQTIIPGPSAPQTLMLNPGEKAAIGANFPPKDALYIALESEQFKVSDAEFVAAREEIISLLNSQFKADSREPLFEKIRTDQHTFLLDHKFISEDRHALLITADTSVALQSAAKDLNNLPEALAQWSAKNSEFHLHYLSHGTVDQEMFELINRDLDQSLLYTLPLTLLVLIWAFRSIRAALIPLVIAVVSLIGSLGLSAILSHLTEPISATSSQLVVLLVLAIGVDYSLFILSRVREERSKGLTYLEAVKLTRSYTGRAVFWSGVTVSVSLLGLTLMGDTILSSMAIVSIVAVCVTVLGCLLVLPSALLFLGERFTCNSHTPNSFASHKFQNRLVNLSVSHPTLAIAISLCLLLALGSFTFRLALGTTVESSVFPETMQSRVAFDQIRSEFPDLAGSDFSIILLHPLSGDISESEEVSELIDSILDTETVRGPVRVEHSADKDISRYEFIAVGSANDQKNHELIHKLRKILFPRLKSESQIEGFVSGTLPFVVDDMERYSNKTPLVIISVLALSFIFLLIAFRSIVVPLKALILNLLSTASAFGVLTLIFVLGVLGRWHFGVIETFVPALLYSILFGLSMDYHVFLLSRVQEEYLKGKETSAAVKEAINSTARTITSAASIMVLVFAIIATLELPLMKELGVGLAVAVIVDATIIRTVLLPASMVLLNDWNWYLPKFLSWMPRIKIGE